VKTSPSHASLRLDWTRVAGPMLPARATRIEIGPGVLGGLAGWIREECGEARRAVLVVDPGAEEAAGAAVLAALEGAGIEVLRIEIAATESEKSVASAMRIGEAAVRWGIDRGTPLVAVGGGCVGDVAAFAASILLRGLPLVLVPTTLLAMVDAAVGGKTAVNLRLPDGSLGRNLLGTFHPASLVVADPAVLRTLPPEEFRAGLAECVKHGWIADPAHLAWLEGEAEAIAAGRHGTRLVAENLAVKTAIVLRDPREEGDRRHLNLGHTFAHAIESRPGQTLRHGEAVALGMVAAAAVAEHLGRAPSGTATRIRRLLARLGLPTMLDRPEAVGDLRRAMDLDKKRVEGRLRLVLPLAPGRIELVEAPPEEAVAVGWRAIGAT